MSSAQAMGTDMVVVSTGFNVESKRLCLNSVGAQRGVRVEHRWVDAADQDPPKTCIENLQDLIAGVHPETPIAWVDLDDWLAHPDALAHAFEAHQAGAWVTYGSFVHADGEKVVIYPHQAGWTIRQDSWRASHLKTFRAGLFQRIRKPDLQVLVGAERRLEWITRAVDLAVMFPILEMAGYERTTFIPETLVVYNYGASTSANASQEVLAFEKDCERIIRARFPYALLESL